MIDQFKTTKDIETFLMIYYASAALGTALELGLFWDLIDNPLTAKEISQRYSIPFDRCYSWLLLLRKLDLLNKTQDQFIVSVNAKNTILNAYSRETWAFLAQEARERYYSIIQLQLNITHPVSVWEAQGLTSPNYVIQMNENPKRAKQFTRMLFELHKSLALNLSEILDLSGVKKLMDLGGGSGVVSLALLKKNSSLNAVVVDIENVCKIGREIANETQEAARIVYHSANFIEDELPKGFDMIIECDVGVYSENLFQKVLYSLNERGCFVIVSNTSEQGAWLTREENNYSLFSFLNTFSKSLEVPRLISQTIDEIKTLLEKVGFQKVVDEVLDNKMIIIRAIK